MRVCRRSKILRNLIRSAGRIVWQWSMKWQMAFFRHLKNLPLSHCARAVAAFFARMARRGGRLSFSASEIAEEVAYCSRQVERAIKELNDVGVIGWDRTWVPWPKSPRGKRYGKNEYSFMPSVCRLGEGSDMVSEQTSSLSQNNNTKPMNSALEGKRVPVWQPLVDTVLRDQQIAMLKLRFGGRL